MGTLTVSSETAFTQTPEQVYDFVTDPRNWPKAYPGSSHIVGVANLPLQVGDEWNEGAPPRVFTWRLITAARPTKWVFQSVGLLGHDPENPGTGFVGLMTVAYSFSTPGDGVTLFHRQMSMELPKRATMPEGMIAAFEPQRIDSYHDAVARLLSET